MDYKIITNDADLAQLCQQAKQQSHKTVMLDTEFVRTRTYHPQLGLIQLFDGEQASLIDPLAIDDMSPLVDLLCDPSITKVLHACGEDLEVFLHHFNCTPEPLVDTQIMAAFLGYGLSTGFARLVQDYLEIELDKSESRADWIARPLTQKQLDYAAADVLYLFPLYEKLQAELMAKVDVIQNNQNTHLDRWQAAQQESAFMAKKRLKPLNKETAYLGVKGAWLLSSEQLAILDIVTQWRLEQALNRDLALNFVLREANMLELCRQKMTSTSAMQKAGFDHREIARHGSVLIKLVEKGMAIPAQQHPPKIVRLMDDPAYKVCFNHLKQAIAKIAQETGLATEFLASKKQLNQYIGWVWRKQRDPQQLPDVMQGWRCELVGKQLESVMSDKPC